MVGFHRFNKLVFSFVGEDGGAGPPGAFKSPSVLKSISHQFGRISDATAASLPLSLTAGVITAPLHS